MHSVEGVPLTRPIVLFQAISKPLVVNNGKENRGIPFSYLPSSAVKQKEGEKMICPHSSNKKQLGKSITQPKSITLMKKIYKHRIVPLKARASFRLNYKLFWKRNPWIQTDNPRCDNKNRVFSLQPLRKVPSILLNIEGLSGCIHSYRCRYLLKITQPILSKLIITDNSIAITRR